MAQNVSQIRHDIESTKEHISQTVEELEGRFQEIKDWKSTVNKHPIPSIAISFGLGFLLSGSALLHPVRRYAGQILTGTITGLIMSKIQGNPEHIHRFMSR